jgi:hypothetical protein
VVKLTVIVALDGLDRGVKLRAHIREKIRDDAEGVGLEAKWKSLGVVCAIIKYDKIIFVTRHTNNRRSQEITMY